MWMSADLIRWLDVYKSLDEVGTVYLSQRGMEGVFTLAGNDQTHQARVKHHLIHHILQACSHSEITLLIKAGNDYRSCLSKGIPTGKKIFYFEQCAAEAVPPGRVHVQVRLVTASNDPGHQVEQQRAASILPVQKCPSDSVSQFLLFCLKGKQNIFLIKLNFILLFHSDSKYS